MEDAKALLQAKAHFGQEAQIGAPWMGPWFMCEKTDTHARFGQYGDGDGQYIWLVGIALGSEENVYVTDEWLHRVVVLDGTGEYLASWGAAGEGDAEFNRPAGIAVDADDNLVVVDSLNHRVQKLTRDGGGGSSPTGAATAMVTASSTHRGA